MSQLTQPALQNLETLLQVLAGAFKNDRMVDKIIPASIATTKSQPAAVIMDDGVAEKKSNGRNGVRYCLKCRHLSGSGPLCTHCGRSFGGRLCNHKKGRHLNPPDANFCGQCGSTQLTEATTSVPLGWISRLLLLILLLGATGVAVPAVFGTLSWPGGWSFQALTGYRSPLVWAIEKSAHILILLLVFYGLSALIPGEAGKQFRSVVTNFLTQLVRGIFKALGQVFTSTLKLLFAWLGKDRNGHKN